MKIVNAAGPFAAAIAAMLGEHLELECVFQQKIAFEDRHGAIPRNMPFAIDLDSLPRYPLLPILCFHRSTRSGSGPRYGTAAGMLSSLMPKAGGKSRSQQW